MVKWYYNYDKIPFMNEDDFLKKFRRLKPDARVPYSSTILSLKNSDIVQVAVKEFLACDELMIKLNGIKAIRKHRLENFHTEVMKYILSETLELKVAAAKTLASFGKEQDFKVLKALYTEYPSIQHLIIDSFSSFSNFAYFYDFIIKQLHNSTEGVFEKVRDFLNFALHKAHLKSMVAASYEQSDFATKRLFEITFAQDLPQLFEFATIAPRLKLAFLVELVKKTQR